MHVSYTIDVRNNFLASNKRGEKGNRIKNKNGYTRKEIVTVLPTKYQDWAEDLGLETPSKSSPQNQFSISNPKDGAIYHRLSNLSAEYQSIKIGLKDSIENDRVEWFLNDVALQTTSKEHTFLWQIKTGDYVLKAVSEKNENLSDVVKFTVK